MKKNSQPMQAFVTKLTAMISRNHSFVYTLKAVSIAPFISIANEFDH